MRIKHVGVRCTCTSHCFLCIYIYHFSISVRFGSVQSNRFRMASFWARSFLHLLICSYGNVNLIFKLHQNRETNKLRALFSANNDIYVINFICLEIVINRKMLCVMRENLFSCAYAVCVRTICVRLKCI